MKFLPHKKTTANTTNPVTNDVMIAVFTGTCIPSCKATDKISVEMAAIKESETRVRNSSGIFKAT